MTHDPTSDLRRYAADLEAQVSADRARAAASRALLNPTPVRRPRRALVAIVATALMGVSNVALATAADPAVPGDTLYGVDRAYEAIGSAVGFDDTHAAERAAEVAVLQERGESAMVLEHVQNTLTDLLASDDPVAAVEEFTAELGNDSETLVAAIMEVAKGTDTTGEEVSAIAREFARNVLDDLDLPDHVQPGGPENPGPPTDSPGNPNPGPPSDPGAGTSDDAGQKGQNP